MFTAHEAPKAESFKWDTFAANYLNVTTNLDAWGEWLKDVYEKKMKQYFETLDRDSQG